MNARAHKFRRASSGVTPAIHRVGSILPAGLVCALAFCVNVALAALPDFSPANIPQEAEKPMTGQSQPSVISRPDGLTKKPQDAKPRATNKPYSDVIESIIESRPTPQDIRDMKTINRNAESADAEPPEVMAPARPTTSMISVNLSPGAIPPVVRIGFLEGATLVFIDSSGHPWPIVGKVNYGAKIIDLQVPWMTGKEVPGAESMVSKNIMTVSYAETAQNLRYSPSFAVFLAGMQTPIVFKVLTGQKNVDYRLDVRVPGLASMNADKGAAGGGNELSNEQMRPLDRWIMEAMDGFIEDKTFVLVKTEDASGVLAWIHRERGQKTGVNAGMMAVRTDGLLLSPAPFEGKKAISSNGMKVYGIPIVPVISVLRNGTIHYVHITE